MLIKKHRSLYAACQICCLTFCMVLINSSVFAQLDFEFPLQAAVLERNLDKLKKQIQSGADVNQKNSKGETPLHLASVQRDPIFAITLIEAGADINAVNAHTQTPLHLASYQGRRAIVELLLKKKAQLRAVTKYKETALHYAARGGRAALCSLLMKEGLHPGRKTAKDNTAMHEAIIGKDSSTIEVFLPRVGLLSIKNKDKFTPLELALSMDFEEMLWPLIVADTRNWETTFQNAFNFAVDNDKPKSMTVLLSRGLKAEDYPGTGVKGLHRAAELGNDAVMQCMMESGADPNTAMSPSNWTALHMAVVAGHASTVGVLIASGANINAHTSTGDTSLHLAVRTRNLIMMNKLLELGADPNTVDEDGRTSLHLAVIIGAQKMLSNLIAKGADPDIADTTGESPLVAAFKANKMKLAETMRRGYKPPLPNFTAQQRFVFAAMRGDGEVINTFMAKEDFEPDTAMQNSVRYIHLVATLGNVELTNTLLDRGIDVNDQRNYPKWTPLHYAVFGGNPDIVQALIDRGADPNLADTNGITPLHLAGRIRDTASWDALVKAGGDETVPDMNGITPAAFKALPE